MSSKALRQRCYDIGLLNKLKGLCRQARHPTRIFQHERLQPRSASASTCYSYSASSGRSCQAWALPMAACSSWHQSSAALRLQMMYQARSASPISVCAFVFDRVISDPILRMQTLVPAAWCECAHAKLLLLMLSGSVLSVGAPQRMAGDNAAALGQLEH